VKSVKHLGSIAAGGFLLVALAVLMVLTSTATIVITLAVIAAVVLGLFRLVLAGVDDGHGARPRS
jgi:hypothetical protein